MSGLVPSPRTRFEAEVARAEEELDLAAACFLVAAEEYPQLVVPAYLRRLDLLAERVRDRLGPETAPLVVLQEITRVLFQEEGFRGNTAAYYDPRNSFLNDVLDRHVGIPQTLGILVLEVGWRLGLALEGVCFPGHFLVRFRGETVRVLLDPFDRGRIRFEDEAQELLDGIYGGMVKLQEPFLRSATKREILAQLLATLKTIYLNARDDPRALAAVERILLVQAPAPEELRDRGILLARTGRVEEAIQDLRHYLELTPEAPDGRRVRGLLRELTEREP